MYTRKDIIEKNKDFIIDQYKKSELTQAEIAQIICVSPETLSRYTKNLGITKKRKSVWTVEKEDWLLHNYNLPYKKLKEHLHLDGETIRLKLLQLGIRRNRKSKPLKLNRDDAELMSDIANPYMTAPEIVEKYRDKYNFKDSAVHHFRKTMRIIALTPSINVSSSLERKVKKALETFDLPFDLEYKLGRYSFDFHLGFGILIEVQGFHHNSSEQIKIDARKKAYAESLGYVVVYIKECDIDEADKIIYDLLRDLGFPVGRLTVKNCVNAKAVSEMANGE